jgi:hypothetical protein
MYGNSCALAGTSRFKLLWAAVGLLALSGCISTALIEHWRDASFAGPPLHKVLVVGVQRDGGRRRIWEDGMVGALAHGGVQATPSYRVFPDKAPSADELAATASREGFDGVLATHFVEASKQVYWGGGFGPYGGYGPYGGFGPYGGYGGRRGYWGGYGDWGYGPGYIGVERRADYQTDVFAVDGAGGRIIWSGITRSVDLSSAATVTDQISRVLVPQLGREGILVGAAKH